MFTNMKVSSVVAESGVSSFREESNRFMLSCNFITKLVKQLMFVIFARQLINENVFIVNDFKKNPPHF